MDLPWKVNEDLRYPVLNLYEIFNIPFHVLQNNGYVMIWVLERTEGQTKEFLKNIGYKYKSRIIWEKTTINDKPVNGNGWKTRHSTETLLIFAKGTVGNFTKYHVCKDLGRAEVQG
jgi:N6-adenosine-specific RNA methylase IME4